MALTKKQRQILDYVESFVESYGYSPSYEEIAKYFGYNSLATVHEHLTNLEQKGFLRKNYNKSRSLEVVRAEVGSLAVELPLMGTVAAGLPLEVFPEQESVSVPHDMVKRGNNYVLRVKGSSMVDEQIRDGDYIIVNSRETAENGEMVVALINGESATVKKFYRERDGRIRLQPANETMQPMFFAAEEVQIQGIVVGVIRKY
ncbi:MAG TPA: transcriptional repressor LexA [Longimicrobiaceae bacterium]|jgi:repressor LexA|nr:transcriptional repressor LexA [Longimicrobiaceae bacterium]